jgi:hypothetical protein
MKFLSFLFTSALMIPAVGMAGSISGGGGGTVPANPVGNAAIAEILKESRSTLLMYFRSLDAGPGKAPMSEADAKRLYEATPTIYDVINETVIEAQSSAPCRDGDGNEVDGSIVATNGGICISLQRLGTKLDRTNAFSQTVALVAHELSHKLGFNEDEATELQKDMLDRLEESNVSARSAADFVWGAASAITESNALAARFDFLDDSDWDSTCRLAKQLNVEFENFIRGANADSIPFSIVSSKNEANYSLRSRVWGVAFSSCGNAQPPLRDTADEKLFFFYRNAFKDRRELTVAEFQDAFWEPVRDTFASAMKIPFIDSIPVAKVEVKEIKRYLSVIRDSAADLFRHTQVTIIP